MAERLSLAAGFVHSAGAGIFKKNPTTGMPKAKSAVSFTVGSLFAGCGGMGLGFSGGFTYLGKKYVKRKFKIVWANDIDADACFSYSKNLGHEIVCDDINNILENKNSTLFENKKIPYKLDVVLGGFPCQDFSLAGKRRGFENISRGQLYKSMAEVIKRTRPKIFVAENVKGLLSAHNGQALEIITKDFADLGYHITWKLYLAADYGVPQMRERVIIVGTDKEYLPPFSHSEPIVNKNKWLTLEEAIGDLELKIEGAIPNHFWSKAKKNKGQGNSTVSAHKPGPTMRSEHHGNIEYHWNGGRRLSAREAARIQSFPDDFVFYPSTSAAYKQIGNAVAPVMAWHIATAIEKFLEENLKIV